MSKLIAFLSTFCLLFLMIGMVVYFRFYAPLTGMRSLNEPAAIVSEVQKLNQLTTVRYVIQKAVGMAEQKQPLGEESILILVEGHVTAGVDLASMNQFNVDVVGRKAVVRLPEARLLDAYLDEKQTRVWDRHITWWTPWVPFSPDLEHRARLQAIEEVKQGALQAGILEQAEKNATTGISDLLRAFGLEVTFEARQRS